MPWKRGPAAWRVVRNSDEVRGRLALLRPQFLSLRQAAWAMALSTQPVRDWLRLGYLRRDGPRGRISKVELARFLGWLATHAEPFDSEILRDRLLGKRRRFPMAYDRLHHARFLWPKGRRALTPGEIAGLIGCHPSLIIKAIRSGVFHKLGRRRTPGRWEITRAQWCREFPCSQISLPGLPSLPRKPSFGTRETAAWLSMWGMAGVKSWQVRRMVRAGELERVMEGPFRKKWQVTRKSLEKVRKSLLTRLREGNF